MGDKSNDLKEINRTERRKARATLKRSGLIASIRSIHKLSTHISYDPLLISEFLIKNHSTN